MIDFSVNMQDRTMLKSGLPRLVANRLFIIFAV